MNPRLLKRLVILFCLGFVMLACSFGKDTGSIDQIVETEESTVESKQLPDAIHYDAPVFKPIPEMPDTGCVDSGNGWITCPEGSPLAELGCITINSLHETLGGFDPMLPIMSCQTERMDEDLPREEYLYNIGCASNIYVRMFTWQDEGFVLIKGMPDLQRLFAPVETPAEAVSFAVAATGFWAGYDTTINKEYRYLVDTIEDTHVLETENGYMVNLFGYRVCGCGPHTYYRVDVTVTKDGDVTAGKPIPLYENPDEDGLCVD